MSNPELLILSQPTWGIDAGSEAFIKKTIVELSQKGVSIIIISHDLDELLEVCHQISVLYEGSLSNPLNVEDINITKLGKYMGGLFDYSTIKRGLLKFNILFVAISCSCFNFIFWLIYFFNFGFKSD